MSIADQLDAIHRDFPGCDVVAFADISARLMLCVNAANARPQEWLDRLCVTAADALDGPAAQAFGQGADRVTESVVLTDETALAFVRSAEAPDDVLCCSCARDVDLDALLARARAELLRMDAGEDGPGGAS